MRATPVAYAAAELDRQGFSIIAKPYRAEALADALDRAIMGGYSRLRSSA